MGRPKVQVMFSRSRDPAKNLEMEDSLFRSIEEWRAAPLFRLWIDSECLVRGKAKNARYGWYNEGLARRLGVRVVERSTGGGVVYHDEGNLNWSFYFRNEPRMLSPLQMFERASEVVVGALVGLGVPARFAPPNRIDVEGRKVSGMAARSTPHTILVHGTLLLRSDLRKLNRLCIPPPGCPPVANLEDWAPGITAYGFARSVVRTLEAAGFGVNAPVSLKDRRSQAKGDRRSRTR